MGVHKMADKIENKEIAVQVSGVKKKYKLGQIGGGSLQADLQSWWARVRGKEDPNSKIGEDQRSNGKTFMALNGVDLTIYKGEAVGIIGGNGAGKSTLLKLLSRVTAPTEGSIDIYGRIASMLEVGTGFNPEMTGRENVYLNGAILGMTKAEIDAKMEEIIEFSEVREFIDTPVKRYSSGMFVKLAFSVAAHLDAEIMIMDEVLAVGDMAFQTKCLDKMRDAAKQEGRTVLYVSHNMNTIRQLCDRCIVLDKGKKIFEGEVEKAIQLYMGIDTEKVFPVHYNLEKIKRCYGFGADVLIRSFSFSGVEQPIYEVGEIVRCEITIKSAISIEGARIFIPIKDGNYTKVCLARSEEFDIIKGEIKTLTVELLTEFLSDDKYCLDVAVVKISKEGNFFTYDDPGEKIIMELKNNFSHGMMWHKDYWGSILLPDMKLYEN